LPRTNSAGAYVVAENLRSTLMSHEFALFKTSVRLTVSIGVACSSALDYACTQQIIGRADSALYRAKHNGKNQACFAEGPVPEAEEVRILSYK
jgi:diguanylate cyclase (GGDEF)-like protein